jgi:hypothetical protein
MQFAKFLEAKEKDSDVIKPIALNKLLNRSELEGESMPPTQR